MYIIFAFWVGFAIFTVHMELEKLNLRISSARFANNECAQSAHAWLF